MSIPSARAWGWVEHLRAGGTTPWAEWSGTGPVGSGSLPAAQNLALLHRLVSTTGGALDPALADAVLSASATGRGRPAGVLAGVGEHRYGPAPVDPADLPDAELVRIASTVLAEQLVHHAPALQAQKVGRPRPWRRRYRLVGDPWWTDPAREQLIARGRPPGGAGAVALVLAGPLDRMLADGWTARATSRSTVTYDRWLGQAGRGRLPAATDALVTAEAWADRVGRRRVHLVLDPAELPGLLGVRHLPGPPTLSADAVELCRRVAIALGHRVPPPVRRGLLREVLVPRLAGEPGEVLGVPERHRAWVAERAEAIHAGVLAGGYPVVGDPAVLTDLGPSTTRPRGAGVLDLAVRQLIAGTPHPSVADQRRPAGGAR